MWRHCLILIFVNIAVNGVAVAASQDIPAIPVERQAPEYPEGCEGTNTKNYVIVRFDISNKGSIENARIVNSTNSCFDDAALSAVQTWRYEPRKVDGAAVAQKGVETKLIFAVPEPRNYEELKSKLGSPAMYPEKCSRDANEMESVTLRYDISEYGMPENIRVIESTKDCFNEFAVKSLAQWRYEPRPKRTDVEVTINFELTQ